MARRQVKSAEWYSRALRGDKDNYGLRSVARGFSSKDVFNLRKGLTPAQKRKVSQAFHELQEITAQPRYVYKPKNGSKAEKEKLRQAQQITQSETKTRWKVAFVPHVPRKLKNGKLSKPRITFGRDGVRITESGFHKSFVPLSQVKMATEAEKEIRRKVKANAPKAQRFTIQAGVNEMPVLSDLAGAIRRVMDLQHKYNGVSQLPKGSGNAGDSPKHHHWKLWLKGLIAYEFPKVSRESISKAVNEFDDARKELQKKRRALREKIRYQAKRNKRR